MKVTRKQKGTETYYDIKNFKVVKKPKYEVELEESKLKQLLYSDRFYSCLVFPIILTMLLALTTDTRYMVILSVLLGIFLVPLFQTINDIFFKQKKQYEKDT